MARLAPSGFASVFRNLRPSSRLPTWCSAGRTELKGNRTGQLSVDLVHPLRLIFRPTAQPPPTKTDGGLDRSKVKSVTIIEVTDPH